MFVRFARPSRLLTRFYSSPIDDKLKQIIQSSNMGKAIHQDIQEADIQEADIQEAVHQKSDIQEDIHGKGRMEGSGIVNNMDMADKDYKGKNYNTSTDSTGGFEKNGPSLFSSLSGMYREMQANIPIVVEQQRREASERLSKRVESLQDAVSQASRTLNNVTGYTAVEKLKFAIEGLEKELAACKDNVKHCRSAYQRAVESRSESQREVNDLLTRKHNWQPHDLERFTELYRNDHANEQRVVEMEKALTAAEQQVDAVQLRLTQSILTRYHEEQIWSDKIRRASTYGTWVLMGINIALFVVATFFVEPWKRRRLVGSFEERVKELLSPHLSDSHLSDSESEKKTSHLSDSHSNDHLSDSHFSDSHSTDSHSSDSRDKTDLTKVNRKNEEVFPYRLSFVVHSWSEAKQALRDGYEKLSSGSVQTVEVGKHELGWLALAVGGIGVGLGYAFR